jgi:hypothetical protein
MAIEVKTARRPKGSGAGSLYVIVILILLFIGAVMFTGGLAPSITNPTSGLLPPSTTPGEQEIVFPSDATPQNTLQMRSFSVSTCQQKTAVDFVIDVSGSMGFDNKIGKERDALTAFTNQLATNSVIGIQTFSTNVQEKIPISYYKDVKTQVQGTINGLQAGGWTSTRDAMNLAKQKLSDAITQNKFPGYQYSLILLTDGVPETQNPKQCEVRVPDPQQGGTRCFAADQDPRIPTDLSADVKNLGVQIYSIGIYSTQTSDQALQPYLQALLQDVASKPLETHFYTTINADNLKQILNGLVQKLCNTEGQ